LREGGLEYFEAEPGPALAPFAACLWSLRASAAEAGLQSVLPDGRMELLFHFGDPFLRVFDDGTIEKQQRVLVAGQLRSRLLLQPTGEVDVVGVRFRPEGAAALLGCPVDEIAGHVIAADDVIPRIAVLAERIHAAEDRLQALRGLVARTFRAARRPDVRLSWAARTLLDNGSVDAAARAAGWSTRQLERQFLRNVGLPPKTLTRIGRIQAVVRAVASGAQHSWGRIAHACGFADQAHMIREFRAIAGETPTAYFGRENALTENFAGGGPAVPADD
jgi:AraC-like DNA-binding protein